MCKRFLPPGQDLQAQSSTFLRVAHRVTARRRHLLVGLINSSTNEQNIPPVDNAVPADQSNVVTVAVNNSDISDILPQVNQDPNMLNLSIQDWEDAFGTLGTSMHRDSVSHATLNNMNNELFNNISVLREYEWGD